MARESELWKRCKTGAKTLRIQGYPIDLQRIENAATVGHPDVEGCVSGTQIWIELKSCPRPARPDTPIRPKKRASQDIWHAERVKAGCRINWILIQVGEDSKACLYLLPGNCYSNITVPEYELVLMSAVDPKATTADVLLRAAQGW